MSFTGVLGVLSAYSHIAGWFGLGAFGTVGFLALAYFAPRYAFHALIAAVLCGSATFIYTKGAFDDFALQQQRQNEAARVALDKFAKDRAAAERAVAAQRSTEHSKPSKRVRDVYDRDQQPNQPVANPKAGVRPVAPVNVLRK